MKFEVSLKSRSTYLKGRNVGLNALDKAREKSGVSNIDPERVDGYVNSTNLKPVAILPETLARTSGRFADDCVCEVSCPDGWAHRYMRLEPDIQSDSTTGEVRRVSWRWQFEAQAFLEDWERQGFPLKIETEEGE